MSPLRGEEPKIIIPLIDDQTFYLLGRVIGDNFFDGQPDAELYKPDAAIDLSSYSPKKHADGETIKLGKWSLLIY
ncbi:MAG: hypothetical protein LBC20_08260 [Planctomycetaceae bacterium]|nr:hypothetical protein [Planctomycetaceae bacterium]